MKKRQVQVGNKTIDYILRKSKRAKKVNLTVGHDARVTVTVPYWAPYRFGEEFILKKGEWVLKHVERVSARKSPIEGLGTEEHYLEHKESARTYLKHKLVEFNLHYGYEYKRIYIRNQRTLWGSCSSSNNLNFNYKILFLPNELADYIVVHELCHLKEMNHSHRFWKLVAETIPDHKAKRMLLKKEYAW